MTFNELASKLSKLTEDSEADKTLDLNVAQASHALRMLKQIAAEDPNGVLEALNIKVTLDAATDSESEVAVDEAPPMEGESNE